MDMDNIEMTTQVFVKDMAGHIIPLNINIPYNTPYISIQFQIPLSWQNALYEDEIKRQIKKEFNLTIPLFCIKVFQLEDKGIYNFIVNDIVNITLDPSIRQVRSFVDTYKRYIVEIYIRDIRDIKDVGKNIEFILYEGDCEFTRDKYYVDNKDILVKYLGAKKREDPSVIYIPDIREAKKFNQALINGISSNIFKYKVCFEKINTDSDHLLSIDDIIDAIKEKIKNIRINEQSSFNLGIL